MGQPSGTPPSRVTRSTRASFARDPTRAELFPPSAPLTQGDWRGTAPPPHSSTLVQPERGPLWSDQDREQGSRRSMTLPPATLKHSTPPSWIEPAQIPVSSLSREHPSSEAMSSSRGTAACYWRRQPTPCRETPSPSSTATNLSLRRKCERSIGNEKPQGSQPHFFDPLRRVRSGSSMGSPRHGSRLRRGSGKRHPPSDRHDDARLIWSRDEWSGPHRQRFRGGDVGHPGGRRGHTLLSRCSGIHYIHQYWHWRYDRQQHR